MESPAKAYSVAGLVLGIVATALSFISFINILALISGIVGLVCSVKGKKMTAAEGLPTGMSTAGLVLSIIGTALAGIGFLTCTVCTLCTAAMGESLTESMEDFYGQLTIIC